MHAATRLLAVSLLVLATACGEPDERPPNLLLVTVDSLRADFLECYGGREGVGANICGQAEKGTRYGWAFAASSSSAPSIASLLTSRYPSAHGVGASAASFLHEDETTLAEELRRAGYATAAFVGSPELNRSRNLQQGFDVYDDEIARSDASGLPQRSAAESTNAAIRWILGVDTPWFVWIHYREPHGPYDSPAAPAAGDFDELPSGPGERLPVLPTPSGRGGIPSYQAIPGLFTREGYEARYRREIRTVDAQLARLLREIERDDASLGLLVTADHGESFGEDRFYFSHGHSVGLEQIRVPLIWRLPERHPERISVTVSTLDVMPTLLQAAGVETPQSAEGRPLPGGEEPPGAPELARAVFAEHAQTVAVVSGENFYSRLREPAAPLPKPKEPYEMSAAYLKAVSGHTARLEDDRGPLPRPQPARPTGVATVLEPVIAEFLERAVAERTFR